MRKFKMFIDIDKEEKYLNEMARNGYIFNKTTVFGFYHFIKDTPADLNYKIDYRGFTKVSDFEDYKSLFDDAGWMHVHGTTYGYNQYFLPKQGTIDNEIFSTEESKAARYKRLFNAYIISLGIASIYYSVMLLSYGYDFNDIGFITPGLWEKTGWNFWRAFLFELPFAFLRTVPILLLISMSALCGTWAYKARKLHKKQKV